MKQLMKDYYALPEAAERCGYPIEDLLWLGEHRHILLSVEAHHWPIVWGDERDFPGDPPIEIKKPIKPPFDSYYSGRLNLFWYDIHNLRANGKLSLTEVYAEKDGRKFVGDIQRGTTEFRARQQECNFEINNVFISHKDLLRIKNSEVGDWEIRENLISTGDIDGETNTELEPTVTRRDGRSDRKRFTQARNQIWQHECDNLKKKNPSMSISAIAERISRDERISDGNNARTVRRIIR